MKRIIIPICCAALALVACQKEQYVPEVPVAPKTPETTETVLTFTSGKPGLDADTKTAWDSENNAIVWSSGDRIKIGYTLDGDWMGQDGPGTAKFYTSNNVAIDGTHANIGTFSVPGNFKNEPGGDAVFYAVYPATSVSATDIPGAPSVTVAIPTRQTPGANTFDGAADILLGHTATTHLEGSFPSEPLPLEWERVVAHADLTFTNLAIDGDAAVDKIVLVFNEEAKVVGNITLDVTTGSVTTGAGTTNQIELTGTNLTIASNAIHAWASVLPVTFTSVDVTVKTDAATYHRNITGISKTFKQNTRNTLSINMASASRTVNTPLIPNGNYVLVAQSGETYYALNSAEKGTSQRRDRFEITTDGFNPANYSAVSPYTAASNLVWTLTNVTGGVMINLAGDASKYMYAENKNTLPLGNTGGIFDVAAGSVSNTFQFSVTVSGALRYMAMNSDNGFACYPSAGVRNLYAIPAVLASPTATATVITGESSAISATGATLRSSFNGASGAVSKTGFFYGTTSGSLDGHIAAAGTASPISATLTGLAPNTKYYYQAYVKEYDASSSSVVTRTGAEQTFTTKAIATSTVTTSAASSIQASSATLSGSYEGATGDVAEVGFYWGTDPANLEHELFVDAGSGASGVFSKGLIGLADTRTYYYKAYVLEYNEDTESYEYHYGEILNFTTPGPSTMNRGYLDCYEMPELTNLTGSGVNGEYPDRDDIWYRYYTSNDNRQVITHTYSHPSKVPAKTRNYTILYDGSKYAPVWTAHAMNKGMWPDNDQGRSDAWTEDPAVTLPQQTGLDNATAVGYSRGHLVASNYRQTSKAQNKQTFYYSNQAPQWQNSFNAGVWNSLEGSVVSHTPAAGTRDTLYVVTGVLYDYVGEIPTLPSGGGTLDVPIPSHFYKCLMMCKFNDSGDMVSANGCAYIFTNEAHQGQTYSDGLTSIDAVEEQAGFDFFHNVPSSLQTAAEAQTTGLW